MGCRITPTPNRCGWLAASAPSPGSFRSPTRSTASRSRVGAALERINRLYTPYHETLRRLLAEAHQAFGLAVLIDCHSMPSNPIDRAGRRPARFRPRRPLRHLLQRRADPARRAGQLKAQGYVVALNKPYAGGYITEHYGRPHKRPARRCRSRSTARSTWTRRASTSRQGSSGLRGDLEAMVQALIAGVSGLAVPRAAAE